MSGEIKLNAGRSVFLARFAIAVVLLAATFLRLYHLGDLSLSNDELSALTRARFDSFGEMIRNGVYIDFHPAGIQVFIYYYIKVFGDSPLALRIPFALLSIASVYLTWEIGKRWFHPAAGLLAAACIAALEFPLLYGQLARMYSPGLFISLLAVYYWTLILDATRSNRVIKSGHWAGYAFSLMAAVHIHYFVIVFLFIVSVFGLFFIRSSDRLKYLACGVAAGISFLPELPVFLQQIKVGDLGGWLTPPQPHFIIDFFFDLFNRSRLVVSLLVVFLLASILMGWRRVRFTYLHVAGIVWFAGVFAVAYGYSVLRAPIIQNSTMLFPLPFLLCTIFSVVPYSKLSSAVTTVFAVSATMLFSYSTVFEKEYFRHPPFGVFKEVAGDISGWAARYGRSNVPAVVNVINPEYMEYYFRRNDVHPEVVFYKAESASDFALLRDMVDTASSGFFAYGWTNSHHPGEIVQIIRNRFPFVVYMKSYFNAEAWLFSRSHGNSITPLRSFFNGFEAPDVSHVNRNDSLFFEGSSSLAMGPETEFSPSFTDTLNSLKSGDYYIYNASVRYWAGDRKGKETLVISIESGNEVIDWVGVELQEYNRRPGSWQQAFISRAVPASSVPLVVKIYVWNRDKRSFLLDDMRATLEAGIDPYRRK